MNWFYYLLEANLYLILFYGFYRLFLHKETFYSVNRFYLLATSLLAFILPIMQVSYFKKPEVLEINYAPIQEIDQLNVQFSKLQAPNESIFTLNNTLITIYSAVAILFLFKFIFSIYKIMRMQKGEFKILENGVKLIDLKGSKVAFSFFNLLFLDPLLPEKCTILKHEFVHIKQKHSVDVMFFEILQIINWFNPITYFIKEDVKLIHEYLADEEITNYDVEKYDYALFLIKNSTGIQDLALTNQIFSSSILKRRISMLNQKKSAKWARLKLLFALPIIGGILCLSTMAFTKDYGLVDLFPKNIKSTQDTSKIKYTTMKNLDKNSKLFTTEVSVNAQRNKQTSREKRLIIINGEKIEDNNKFFAAANYDKKTELSAEEATKKYGYGAKYGAIELSGKNIEVLKDFPKPPPNKENQKIGTLEKTVLLPPPPPIDIKNNNLNKPYNIDIVMNRSEREKLVSPATEKGKKSISIYTTRGEKVFITSDYKNDWDGKINSFTKKPLPEGNYSYELIITQGNGAKSKIIRGYITLM